MKKRIALYTIFFIAALGIVLYPIISQLWNNYVMEQLITDYEQNVSSIEDVDYTDEWEAAYEYNSLLASGTSYRSLADEYESTLNVLGNGVMGYITIPCINVKLPVYHYAIDDVLSRGAGHLETSSLPVGGESCHSVITGHRGLPSSTLFTRLDEVAVGDVFYLNILDETLAYEVYEIEVVLPEETESLAIQTGEDLCTLVTCTPYGVNTHRLLIHAERTEYTEELSAEKESVTSSGTPSWFLLAVALIELLFYIWIIRRIKRQYRETENETGAG